MKRQEQPVTLSVFDIKQVIKLPCSHNKEKESTRISTVFTHNDAKQSVMKAKKRLKETRNLWIMVDLTFAQAKLAYEARKAVREETIHQTWTFDSRYFKYKDQQRCQIIEY